MRRSLFSSCGGGNRAAGGQEVNSLLALAQAKRSALWLASANPSCCPSCSVCRCDGLLCVALCCIVPLSSVAVTKFTTCLRSLRERGETSVHVCDLNWAKFTSGCVLIAMVDQTGSGALISVFSACVARLLAAQWIDSPPGRFRGRSGFSLAC